MKLRSARRHTGRPPLAIYQYINVLDVLGRLGRFRIVIATAILLAMAKTERNGKQK
jgi:hypothetical protein